MFIPRVRYFCLLLLALIYWFASGEWLSFVLLCVVAALPWLSLLLSLPAILRFRLSATGVAVLNMGEEAEAWLLGSCPMPMPPFRGRIRVTNLLTGESRRYQDKGLPTAHCGGMTVKAEKGCVCDYMGIFAFPARCGEGNTVLVRPKAVSVAVPMDLERFAAHLWRPKPGGGFSENHELRLYRPGDNLNQVHWKLSAKAGKLILREPMEPQRGLMLLTLDLCGTPEELDRKLGRLLSLGKILLDKNLNFEVRALCDEGIISCPVADSKALARCADTLLCKRCASTGSIRDISYAASWQYYIGGGADEV